MDVNSYFTLIVFSISLLIYHLFVKYKRNEKPPPGPYGLPLLGYWPFIRTHGYKQFLEMSNKYGKVFQMKVGTRSVLVLNDWESINEALNQQMEVFSGRPDMHSFRMRTNYKDLVGQNSTPAWKQQRRFAFSTLRDMGMGKSKAELSVLEEVDKFTQHLGTSCGQIIKPQNMFFIPVLNVIWNIATGLTFKYGSKKLDHFSIMLARNFQFISGLNAINVLPFPTLFAKKIHQEYQSNNEQIKELLTRYIKDFSIAFDNENEPQNYIEVYLKKLYGTSVTSNEAVPQKSYFSEERLLGDLYIFFHAGAETSSNTLSWSILYMSMWPNIQRKVQREIDQVIGKSKLPSYSDREILPYTYATLLETQRIASIVPLSIPHMTKSATKLCGFDIAKNTTVWPNLWAVSHDPDLWGDPEVFRPERFLDVTGKIHKPDYFIPFSTGARRCLGERLAKMEIFLFFSTLMQRFEFVLPPGHQLPSLEAMAAITLRPHPFSVIIKDRTSEAANA